MLYSESLFQILTEHRNTQEYGFNFTVYYVTLSPHFRFSHKHFSHIAFIFKIQLHS